MLDLKTLHPPKALRGLHKSRGSMHILGGGGYDDPHFSRKASYTQSVSDD